jgi:hypothetical protein
MRIPMTAAACLLLTTGCADGGINKDQPWMVEPGAAARTSQGPLRERQIDLPIILHTALKKQQPEALKSLTVEEAKETDLDKLILLVDISGDKLIRNSTIAQLMAASTTNCGIYLNNLRGGQVSNRLIADLASSSFSIAASLIEPIETARVFSGIAAFSTSAGASIDRNIFAQQGAELVADAIVQLREKDRAYIEGRMNEDLTRWPMGLALTDFARFHADCSMLRGLSQMREAVTARELEVRSVRAAAMAVAQRGGTGLEVAAAVTGSVPNVVTIEPRSSTPTASDFRGDLDRMKSEALKCFNSATRAFSDDPAERATPAASCSADPKSKWENRYIVWVNDDLEKIDLSTAEKHATASRSQDAAIAALAQAKAKSTPDQVEIQTLDQAVKDAENQRTAALRAKDDVKAKLDTARTASLQRIETDILRVSTTRSMAVSTISSILANQSIDAVEQVLSTIAGELAKTDPAFVLAIEATRDVKALEGGGTALLAAANARATILSVAKS